MHAEAKRCIASCDMCQRVKHVNVSMDGEQQLVYAAKPLDLVTVDFYGPLPQSRGGVRYILVVLDAFSKYVRLYPMKKATTKVSLKKILEDFVPICGKPKKILSDNGSQFSSMVWREGLEEQGIRVVYSPVRHPQSNPAERVMRELGRLFRTLCSNQHTKWANFISEIEQILNITTHFSTGYAPKELHFNQPIVDDIQNLIKFPPSEMQDYDYILLSARSNIERNFKNRKKQQKSISKIKLNIGDLVLLRVPYLSNALENITKKFCHLYEGPYRISRLVGKNAFNIFDLAKSREKPGSFHRESSPVCTTSQ